MLRLAETTQETAGPKAAILGRLAAAGFPVPPGFVIPVDAYRAFTDRLNLTQVLADQSSEELRHLIETQPLPPQLLRELTTALTDLGDLPVAVRSSATTEDNADASAAGQHDTYLGIQGANAVADRVRACWSSLWSDRATTYRHTHQQPHTNTNTRTNADTHVGTGTGSGTGTYVGTGSGTGTHVGTDTDAGARAGTRAGLDTNGGAQAGTRAGLDTDGGAQPGTGAGTDSGAGARAGADEPGIAVIVQRHIDAEVAGVLFASEGMSIIEASWGLGESVVQGLVTPDAFTISREGRTEHSLGSKLTRIDRSPAGTTSTTQVPARDRERPCLTDYQLAQLHQLGQAVTAHLGAPQDIEFALDSTHLWLLQSRPITTPLPPDHDVRGDRDETPLPPRGHDVPSDRGETALPPKDNDVRVGRGEVAARPTREGAGIAGEVVLQGVGGSAGTASGVARVVEGPEDFGRVGVGEILVCRFTDPAWTPLFSVVAGVVTETGGRLSHAAIVAREHRIPAVLGVPDLMTTVLDGQQLTITGGAGTVRLLSS